MKILFVTPLDPYECYSGGGVRTRVLWEALKKNGDVYTTVISTWGERLCSQKPLEGDRIKYAKDFDARTHNAKFRHLVMRGFIDKNLDRYFLGKEEVQALLGWSGERFDLVVTRFAWMNTKIAAWKIAPVILDVDDLPTEDFKTLHKKQIPFLQGLKGLFIVNWWQNLSFRMAKGAWLPNQFQISVVKRHCPCMYLPNIAKTVSPDFDKGIGRRKRLFTVGSLDYKANREGIDWFIRNIWPKFSQIYPGYEYVVAGYGLPQAIKDEWSLVKGVKLLGFVENLDLAYAECEAVIAPVFTGGGTAVKVIEAIAHKRKVFATKFALRGLTDTQISQAGVIEFKTAQSFISAYAKWRKYSEYDLEVESDRMRHMIEDDYSVSFFESQVTRLIAKTLGK